MTGVRVDRRGDGTASHTFDSFFIGGRWVRARGGASIEVHDSTTEEVIARVPEGTPEHIDAAVAAAQQAFPIWSTTSVDDRVAALKRIKAGLKARADELIEVIGREVGMPVPGARLIQVGLPRANFSNAAKVLEAYEFERPLGNSLIVREPVGVVGAITPWNVPLHQIALKVAPALATGNTVVLKPSEIAPINAFILAEIIEEADLPGGAFNLVTGYGVPVGEALAAHPDVDMISFTGSTVAGKRVARLASGTIKRVALELGGKSATVLLDDAEFEWAVPEGVARCFRNSGQTCTSLSRMLVPRERLAEAEALAASAAEQHTLGDPFEEVTQLGPLVSAAQRDRVRRYISTGLEEGARLVTGGVEAPDGLDRGYFVRPTVFSDVRSDMTIAREEIFGPVLCLIPYESEDEAVRIANDSIYGLSGAVWSADPQRAERVARRLRTGQVEVNGGPFNVWAPFGGYKQSGLGREAGTFGFEEYLEIKAIQR